MLPHDPEEREVRVNRAPGTRAEMEPRRGDWLGSFPEWPQDRQTLTSQDWEPRHRTGCPPTGRGAPTVWVMPLSTAECWEDSSA